MGIEKETIQKPKLTWSINKENSHRLFKHLEMMSFMPTRKTMKRNY